MNLGELKVIPCSITSTPGKNDYQPRVLEENEPAYERVMQKLAGTYQQ